MLQGWEPRYWDRISWKPTGWVCHGSLKSEIYFSVDSKCKFIPLLAKCYLHFFPRLKIQQSPLRHFFSLSFRKIILFSGQKLHSVGERGGLQIFLFNGILIFLLLRSPCKISESYDNPFWDFSNGGEKKMWKIHLPKIVAYLSCSAGRTHLAQTKNNF